MKGDERLRKQKPKRPYLNNSIRDRLKTVDEDIAQIWNEQKYLINKRKKNKNKQRISIASYFSKAKILVLKINKKYRLYKSFSLVVNNIKKHKRVAATVGTLSLVVIVLFFSRNKSEPKYITDTLGASSISSNQVANTEEDIKIVEKEETDFTLLFPDGKNQDALEVALISPPSNDPVYAYIDDLGGQKIQISQQRLPESFNKERDTKLQALAKDFQATNVISVDESNLYHGYSEKTKVQSVIFIKNNTLVFISSPQKQSDDVWVAYYLSLK